MTPDNELNLDLDLETIKDLYVLLVRTPAKSERLGRLESLLESRLFDVLSIEEMDALAASRHDR